MTIFFLIGCVLLVIASVVILSFVKKFLELEVKGKDLTEYTYDLSERIILVTQIRRVVIIISSVVLVSFLVYWLIRDTPMQGFTMEWLNLIVRWTHVVVGIMWIGASFYFIFLENNLNRTDGVRDELAGNLWAIHGGGFYFLEKYKVAPKTLPKTLHWFKYEAYFTWISGFTLLTIVYYMDARSFLIDPQVADLSVPVAIAIGVGTMVFGWIVYDAMCKSALVKKPVLFAIIGFLILSSHKLFFDYGFQ